MAALYFSIPLTLPRVKFLYEVASLQSEASRRSLLVPYELVSRQFSCLLRTRRSKPYYPTKYFIDPVLTSMQRKGSSPRSQGWIRDHPC